VLTFTRIFPSKLVRHSAARVIAAIASIEIPNGTWNELLPFLQQTCQSPDVNHRDVGSFILFAVLESIVEGFQLNALYSLFGQLVNDPESIEVRITTVRYVCLTYLSSLTFSYLGSSLGVIAQYIEGEDKTALVGLFTYPVFVHSLTSKILRTRTVLSSLQYSMSSGKQLPVETKLVPGIYLMSWKHSLFLYVVSLYRFAFCSSLIRVYQEIPILGKNIPELVEFLLRCGGDTSYDPDLRVLALNALNWTVQ
jgi:hypothetical protein